MVPVSLSARFHFALSNRFHIKPELGLGSMISLLHRNTNPYVNEAYSYKTAYYANPIVESGITCEYMISNGMNIFAKTNYMVLFDKGKYGSYATISFGGMFML